MFVYIFPIYFVLFSICIFSYIVCLNVIVAFFSLICIKITPKVFLFDLFLTRGILFNLARDWEGGGRLFGEYFVTIGNMLGTLYKVFIRFSVKTKI